MSSWLSRTTQVAKESMGVSSRTVDPDVEGCVAKLALLEAGHTVVHVPNLREPAGSALRLGEHVVVAEAASLIRRVLLPRAPRAGKPPSSRWLPVAQCNQHPVPPRLRGSAAERERMAACWWEEVQAEAA